MYVFDRKGQGSEQSTDGFPSALVIYGGVRGGDFKPRKEIKQTITEERRKSGGRARKKDREKKGEVGRRTARQVKGWTMSDDLVGRKGQGRKRQIESEGLCHG